MYKRMVSLTAICTIILIISSVGCSGGENAVSKVTKKAPEFTMKDLNGRTVALSDFRGKKSVLLAFGATWCPHCVDEVPELKEVNAAYKEKGLAVLYVDIQESQKKVQSFAEYHKIDYPVLLDETGDVARSYGVYGIPHLVVIDKDGFMDYEGHRPRDGIMALLDRVIE